MSSYHNHFLDSWPHHHNFKTLMVVSILLLALTPVARPQSDEVKRALEQYARWRPSDEKLIAYRLDWEPSVETALKRAAHENRPVFIIAIHARYGEMLSGHC